MIRWKVNKTKKNYKRVSNNMMNIWSWKNAFKACNPYNRKDKENKELNLSKSVFGELTKNKTPWEDHYEERLRMLEDSNTYVILK